jgi:hypothetical protein
MTSTPLARRLVITAAVLFVLAGKPAWAQQGPPATQQCMSNLASCYYWAAAQAGFFYMWGAGIDCELNVANCIRQLLIGR